MAMDQIVASIPRILSCLNSLNFIVAIADSVRLCQTGCVNFLQSVTFIEEKEELANSKACDL